MRFWKRIAAASAVTAVASTLALLLVLLPASGADAIDQSVTGGPSGHVEVDLFDVAQTFTPQYGSLTRIDVYLRTADGVATGGNANVTLEVWKDSAVVPVVTKTELVSSGFTGDWVTFDFPTVAIATSPEQYAIVLTVDVDEDLAWAYQASDPYAAGTAFVDGVGQGYDFMFKTYLEDVTGPSITPNLSVPVQADNWYNTNVGLTWTVTDPDSPITSTTGCAPQNIVADQAITVYSCSATSTGGSTGPVNVSIGRDTVKPVIALNTITLPNGSGWNNTDVIASFTCTDALSGVDGAATSLPNVTLTTEGAGQSITNTGQCVDNAGNVADPLTITGINIDKTAPTGVFLSVTSGTLGSNGWYVTDVTIHTNGADSISPVSCTADQFQTTDTSGTVFNGSCTNDAGLTTNAAPLNIKVDKTAPTATLAVFSGVAGSNGWYVSNVTMRTSGTDGGSGVASCTADQPFTNETTGTTVNGSCTDNAGHTTNATPFNLKIDKSAPTGVFLSVTAGTPGANGWYTSDVTVHTNGTDNVSPITSCTADQFQTTDTTPAGQNFNGSCTNEAGLFTSAPVLNIKLDKTAPTATLSVFSGTLGSNGWYTSDVVVQTTGTDATAGPPTCTANQTINYETTGVVVNGSCTNAAGLTTNAAPLNIKIDKTGPTGVALSVTAGTPGANGWYTSDVTVHTDGADNVSPITSCTADQFQTTDTTPAGQNFNGSCTNEAGLVTNAPVLNIKLDKTAPTATLSVFSGTLGANGWYTSSVVVQTTGTDSNSGIDFCTADQTFNLESTGFTVNGSCTDDAGHTTNAAPLNLKIDMTAPSGVFLSVTAGTLGSNGWYTSDVTVHTNGSDSISPFTCSADQFQTTETTPAGQNFNGSCTNEAGLVTNASTLNIKLDKTAPTATLSVFSGTLGANGWYTSSVVVQTTGTDGNSGIDTCTGNQTFNFESTGFIVNGSCTDDAGHTTNAAPLNLKIDMTAPAPVFLSVTAGTLGNAGWYLSDVTVHTNGTDAISGVTCTADQFQNADTAGTNFNGSCTNGAGLVTNASQITIKLDKTAPTASLSVISGTLGNLGWYISDVVVRTTGFDGLSGLSGCTPDQPFSAESAGFTVNGSCEDVAGNVTNATPLNLKIDKTPPVTTLSTTPAAPDGLNGWFISPVTITANGVDALSGIDSCTSPTPVNTDTTGVLRTGTCTDNAGNSSSDSLTIKLDTTDPVADILVVDGTEGANGWYISSVIAEAFGSDTISGPVVCTPQIQALTTETTGTVLAASCVNQAGRATPVSVNVKIDKTPPVTTLNTLPAAPNGFGWFTSDVSIFASYLETISDPTVDCTDPFQITTETTGTLATVTCTNDAGLSSSASQTIKLDKTGPTDVILEVSSGTLGDNGWYTSNVIVSTTGTDNISGPVTCTLDQALNIEMDEPGQTFNGSCTNQAGLTTNATPLDVKIDKTAPTNVELTITAGTLGNNGWYKSDVTIETTSDAETISDPVACTADQFQTTDTIGQVFNGSCTNDAGLTADAAPLTVKLDKTPPTLAPTVPAAIAQNSAASATPNATDATSGIASQSCGALNTAALGNFTTTCTATDNAGNTTTVNVNYQVISTTGDCGKILFGTVPPPGGGVGTFAFSCGTIAQLIAVTGCNQATMTIYYNKTGGGYAVYIPASQVAAVNQEFLSIFNGNPQIPVNTIFSVKCI